MSVLEGHVEELKYKSIVGFDGSTVNGFVIHPDNEHIIYALGNNVVVQHYYTQEQFFLSGHTNLISAIDVSESGNYIASGQINHIGFKAMIIIWKYKEREMLCSYELHKVRVQAIAFSIKDRYCISVGGRDCGQIVVWNIATNKVLCGAQAAEGAMGEPTALRRMNWRPECFITVGDNHSLLWKIDPEARNVRSIGIKQMKLRRYLISCDVDPRDYFAYCGTTTGDICKILLNYPHDTDIVDVENTPAIIGCFARTTSKPLPYGAVSLYNNGVVCLKVLLNSNLIVGAGDGLLELVAQASPQADFVPGLKYPSTPLLKSLRRVHLCAGISTIKMFTRKGRNYILVGTLNCEIFEVDFKTFESKLKVTCHTNNIYDIKFPYNFSEVFATASEHDVRIWALETKKELVRIIVKNFHCSSLHFTYDGKYLITGWNDGIIRAFTPITGKLVYAIFNAHNKGVSALTMNKKGDLLVSGGCEGQVRLWSISTECQRQKLLCVLKEHKAPIATVDINCTDDEAITAGADGSCVIWDLIKHCRRQVLMASCLFTGAIFYPSGIQVLTCASDRKVTYWEVYDGSLIREIEASTSSAINCVDISKDGKTFLTCGNDQVVKLWDYNDGITTHIGLGHSGSITKCRFSPNMKYILTTTASGEIFIWLNPHHPEDEPEKEGLECAGIIPQPVEEEDSVCGDHDKLVVTKTGVDMSFPICDDH